MTKYIYKFYKRRELEKIKEKATKYGAPFINGKSNAGCPGVTDPLGGERPILLEWINPIEGKKYTIDTFERFDHFVGALELIDNCIYYKKVDNFLKYFYLQLNIYGRAVFVNLVSKLNLETIENISLQLEILHKVSLYADEGLSLAAKPYPYKYIKVTVAQMFDKFIKPKLDDPDLTALLKEIEKATIHHNNIPKIVEALEYVPTKSLDKTLPSTDKEDSIEDINAVYRTIELQATLIKPFPSKEMAGEALHPFTAIIDKMLEKGVDLSKSVSKDESILERMTNYASNTEIRISFKDEPESESEVDDDYESESESSNIRKNYTVFIAQTLKYGYKLLPEHKIKPMPKQDIFENLKNHIKIEALKKKSLCKELLETIKILPKELSKIIVYYVYPKYDTETISKIFIALDVAELEKIEISWMGDDSTLTSSDPSLYPI